MCLAGVLVVPAITPAGQHSASQPPVMSGWRLVVFKDSFLLASAIEERRIGMQCLVRCRDALWMNCCGLAVLGCWKSTAAKEFLVASCSFLPLPSIPCRNLLYLLRIQTRNGFWWLKYLGIIFILLTFFPRYFVLRVSWLFLPHWKIKLLNYFK